MPRTELYQCARCGHLTEAPAGLEKVRCRECDRQDYGTTEATQLPRAAYDETGCVAVSQSAQATGDYVICMGVGSSAARGNSNIVIGTNARASQPS